MQVLVHSTCEFLLITQSIHILFPQPPPQGIIHIRNEKYFQSNLILNFPGFQVKLVYTEIISVLFY